MQDIGLLCQKYLDLPDKRVGVRLCGTQLKYQGPNSVVFSDGETVIKIMTTGRSGDAEREYQRLCDYQCLGSEKFVLPKPLGYGGSPEEHVVMSDIGDSFFEKNSSEADYLEAAKAIGEFAGKLWNLDGSVYLDFHPKNFTRTRDGKIGIIDFGSVVHDMAPEAMFWTPLGINAGICPTLASAFAQETGREIDFDMVESLAKKKMTQPLNQDHLRLVRRNLDGWRKQVSRRPGDREGVNNSTVSALEYRF